MRFPEVYHHGTSRGDMLQKRYRSQGIRKRAVGERNGGRRRGWSCAANVGGSAWLSAKGIALEAGSVQSGGEAARAGDQASTAITIKERI
jgi:hypothetical protein